MNATFEKLTPWLEKANAFSSALTLFSWDDATEAPEAAAERNAMTVGILSAEYYNTIINEEVKSILEELRLEQDLSPKEAAIAKDLRKQYEEMEPIPPKEYQEYQSLIARASSVWEKAKKENDYSLFAPTLASIISYQKKFAAYRIQASGKEMKPYDLLLNDFEEGFSMERLDVFFETLKKEILPLVRMVVAKEDKISKEFNSRRYPAAKQDVYNRMLAKHVGFDFTRGVIKESAHPFTTNFHNRDVRITTHYYEDNLESAMFSTIHESGHALYEMHIDDEITGTPVGTGTSMGMHEGQSRLFENNFGRSRAFWIPLFGQLKETFPENLADVDLDTFLLAINKSTPSLIRTEADELTYCLHIMVRYEIEKMIFEDQVSIDELPSVWNQKYEEYLGLTPQNDAEGILQDIHWANGAFGYFPSYALGTAVASQIEAHLKQVMPLSQYLEEGNFAPINDYLAEHIHRFGKMKNTNEILKDMMGEEFNPQYYIDYLKTKFTSLYENL